MKFTANGTYPLTPEHGSYVSGKSVVYVSGTASGATITLSYVDEDGNVIPLTDGVVTANTQNIVSHGAGVKIFAVISGGGGGIALNITLAVLPD